MSLGLVWDLMETINSDPLLTLSEAGQYLGMSSKFVREQIAQGHLHGTFIGRFVRVRRSALEAYIELSTQASGDK